MEKYNEVVDYLYSCTPQFQLIGAGAYKPGLQTAISLDKAFGSPHGKFKTIHVAGTNGKGSTSHTIAAVLQAAGYKVGLYTSPHLVDFRERIKVNGEMISEDGVIDFVERFKAMNPDCEPSFFELTTIMAFDWFASQGVDVAVIETGLGGRLDTTNIITPILSIITNISLDHVAQLGNTHEAIAREKAGIIKAGIPVVLGEATTDTRHVFEDKAREVGAPLVVASDKQWWRECRVTFDANQYIGTSWGDFKGALSGECQIRNAATILAAIDILRHTFDIDKESVKVGFGDVVNMTGLMGRWMIVNQSPVIVCDTGHNIGGWQYIMHRLEELPRPLYMVIGFVNDKDVDHVMELMPKDAYYLFTNASIPRAMPAAEVCAKGTPWGLKGEVVSSVKEAVARAIKMAGTTGSVFVGGSTFVVADFFKYWSDI